MSLKKNILPPIYKLAGRFNENTIPGQFKTSLENTLIRSILKNNNTALRLAEN